MKWVLREGLGEVGPQRGSTVGEVGPQRGSR